MSKFDRASASTAGQIINSLFAAEPESRRPFMELLASDIEMLSQEYPDHWGVTLFPDRVRLNAGRVECVTLSDKGLKIIVLRDPALPTSKRLAVYKHAPGCVMIRIGLTDAGSELRDMARSHVAAIRVAARYGTTPAIRNAHSSGVVDFLSAAAGRPLGVSGPRYWIVKGRPADNAWEDALSKGRVGTWYTARRPQDLAKDDRVFVWSSSPDRRLVGLAVVVRPDAGKDEQGRQLFAIRYLTGKLSDCPGIKELRAAPALKNASFLKSGPAATILRLTTEEGEALYSELFEACADVGNVWPELQLSAWLEEDLAVIEGRRSFQQHLRLERNRKIVETKKRLARGQLYCAVCGFDFERVYGIRGKDFCEVHHLIPLAENGGNVKTRLEDLAIVCANCHRMLHRSPWMSVDQLRKLVSEHIIR